MTHWSFLVKSDESAFEIAFFDFRQEPRAGNSPQGFFDGIVASTVKKFSGTIVTNHRFSFSTEGFPAREIVLDLPDGKRIIDRIYLVKRRMYQAFVIGRPGIEKAEDTRTFLDSFQLLPD